MATFEPLLVEVKRNNWVESRHHVHAMVMRADRSILDSWGEKSRPTFPRSAVKLIQAIPLVTTGAAASRALTTKQLAIACASHNGEEGHVQLVKSWLDDLGLGEMDLFCGPHRPYYEPAAQAIERAGSAPCRWHNNCSGKHSGMLTLAQTQGWICEGYQKIDHPVQQAYLSALKVLTANSTTGDQFGIDGCGVPTFASPLDDLGHAAAQIADPAALPSATAEAVKILREAAMAEPWYVAGTGRFDTEVMSASDQRIFAKIGAEGVVLVALPSEKLGIIVKSEDGAERAAQTAAAWLIQKYLPTTDQERAALAPYLETPIKNSRQQPVGTIAMGG